MLENNTLQLVQWLMFKQLYSTAMSNTLKLAVISQHIYRKPQK